MLQHRVYGRKMNVDILYQYLPTFDSELDPINNKSLLTIIKLLLSGTYSHTEEMVSIDLESRTDLIQ